MKKDSFFDYLNGPVCFYIFGDVFFVKEDKDYKDEILKRIKR